MPYITQFPSSFLTLDADTGAIVLGDTRVLNALNNSQEFDIYDVEATEGTTLSGGDSLTTLDENGNPVVSGTYAGSGTLSTASINVLDIEVQVDPVAGHFVQSDDGNAYFISDEPFDGNNLGVTLTFPLGESVSVPLSELADVPLLGAALEPVLAGVNNILNTAAVSVDYNPAGTLVLDDPEVLPCFLSGTLILTERGEVAVEALSVGDTVLTRDHGPRPIRWIGSRVVTAAGLARSPNLRPIRIRAGALGAGTPSSDLLVSPQHRVLVRSKIAQRMFGTDEILVAAKQLLPLDGIEVAEDIGSVEYFHILFDRHEVVISNGAETESLYTGPEALRAVGRAAQEEIFTLFPELRDHDHKWLPARPFAPGRMARRLADRHAANGKPLVG